MLLQVEQGHGQQGTCPEAPSLCGVYAGLYPDAQPMGYPLDRVGRVGVETLREFLTPNMFLQEVTVRLRDTVLATYRNATVFGDKDTVERLPPRPGITYVRHPPVSYA